MKQSSSLMKTSLAVCILILLPVYILAQDHGIMPDKSVKDYDNQSAFTSKGRWMAGGILSLNFKNTNEMNQLVRYVQEDMINDFTVKLDGAYAFRDFNFAGMGLLYGETRRSGIYQNSDGVLYNEDFFGNSYSFRPFLKNLTSLDDKGRFNIVTQIELWYQLDQGITQTILNDNVTRKLTTGHTGLLGLRPGINVFVIRNVAVETTLNVAGVKYSYQKTETTGLPDSRTSKTSVGFKIDILQLNIGIFVYI